MHIYQSIRVIQEDIRHLRLSFDILYDCEKKIFDYQTDWQGQITISSDPSPLFGIQFLAIPFAFDFAFKMHIKEKSFKHSIN